MKRVFFSFLSSVLLVFTSCDEHQDFPDVSTHVSDVLCTDGTIMRYQDFSVSGKEAIGVIFYLNQDSQIEGNGYAVYLKDIDSVSFADSLGVSQKTSCSLTAHDGNLNTYSIMAAGKPESELAAAVFSLWRYGQSAYVPSVAQMKLLYRAKNDINDCLGKLGGDPLPDEADDCWYWTSTEVSGQDLVKAWLYSMGSGAIQETPKDQPHKIRPIITLNY